MKFIVLKKGENLGDLATRIAARTGAQSKERTLAALREANPQLAELEKRPATADTIVMLPRPVAGTAPPPRDQPTLPETLLNSVLERLDDAFAAVANMLEVEEQEANAAASRISSDDITKLARTEPELEKELVGVTKLAAERVTRAKTARAAEATLVKLIGDDVAALRKAVLERSSIATALTELEPSQQPVVRPIRPVITVRPRTAPQPVVEAAPPKDVSSARESATTGARKKSAGKKSAKQKTTRSRKKPKREKRTRPPEEQEG